MSDKYVTFKNVSGKDIWYKNFSGRPTKYIPDGGKRTFTVVFDDIELARMMAADGWTVRFRYIDGEEEPSTASLEIKVRYNDNNPSRNPNITQGTRRGDPVRLDEESVGGLDYVDILEATYVTVRGWEYETGKRSAYLVRASFIIDECLDSYRDVDMGDEDLPF